MLANLQTNGRNLRCIILDTRSSLIRIFLNAQYSLVSDFIRVLSAFHIWHWTGMRLTSVRSTGRSCMNHVRVRVWVMGWKDELLMIQEWSSMPKIFCLLWCSLLIYKIINKVHWGKKIIIRHHLSMPKKFCHIYLVVNDMKFKFRQKLRKSVRLSVWPWNHAFSTFHAFFMKSSYNLWAFILFEHKIHTLFCHFWWIAVIYKIRLN